MSTIDRQAPAAPPPLVDGQRLDRATFHERYAALPESTRAELIGGVVFMGSPVELNHGRLGPLVASWLGWYAEFTPGSEVLARASVFFEDYGEPQPDFVLRIRPDHGGRTRDEGKYYADGPELVVELSDSTLKKDLGPKLADYDRAGVPEYIVYGLNPPSVRWHERVGGSLVEVVPDPDGLYRSKVFPGLWLDPAALLRGDRRAIRATVDLGLATAGHAEFVERLAEAGGAGRG